MTGDEITNSEIVWRLEDLRREVRELAGAFVRTELYESQRQDSGRRIGDVERDVTTLQADLKSQTAESERRYRTSVNLALGAFLSFLGGAALLLLQLVAK